MNLQPKLELACFDLESAITAVKSGVHRIELCHDYTQGGLTPALEDFRILRKITNIPIYVMIRPHAQSFIYSAEDVRKMKSEIEIFGSEGADGLVFGALNANNQIDEEVNSVLLEAAGLLPCTLHRAFDRCPNPFEALGSAMQLGFTNILSSGGEKVVWNGVTLLNQLKASSHGRINFVAGGGVRSENISELKSTFITEFYHSSAILPHQSKASESEIKALLQNLK